MNPLNDKDYLAACLYELRKAKASLAYDPRDPRRIARHIEAQRAVTQARQITPAKPTK